MGRYSYSGRLVADGLHKIDINWLGRKGMLVGYCNQNLTWSNQWGKTGNIDIVIKISDEEKYAKLSYTITRRSSGERVEFDYKVQIVTANCYFGGIRYWFICPAVGCGRKVAKIYQGQDIFACRHCYHLTYSSRNESSTYKHFPYRELTMESKIDKLYEKMKKSSYKGKPTRIMKQIMRIENKMGKLPENIESYLYK